MADSSETKSGREILKPYKSKLSSEQLEMYTYFKKRNFSLKNKKGKGSYKRIKSFDLD